MDVIRVVITHDHPIMGVGKHILEEMRHLFDVMPDTLLIEMTLADEPVPTLNYQAESAPTATRVFVLRDYHNHAYVFGLLSSGLITELAEHDALRTIAEAIQSGLDGTLGGCTHRLVAKAPPRQLEGVATATPDLTTRELDVLRQLITGKTDQAIGQHLSISQRTVQYHLSNIYQKLGVKRRSEAIVWAMRSSLCEE